MLRAFAAHRAQASHRHVSQNQVPSRSFSSKSQISLVKFSVTKQMAVHHVPSCQNIELFRVTAHHPDIDRGNDIEFEALSRFTHEAQKSGFSQARLVTHNEKYELLAEPYVLVPSLPTTVPQALLAVGKRSIEQLDNVLDAMANKKKGPK